MLDPITPAIGGLLGAVIGVIWSDPFRDNSGQFTTRKSGFGSWITQAIIGGFFGALLTTFAISYLANNPVIGIVGFFLLLYAVYRIFIDPR